METYDEMKDIVDLKQSQVDSYRKSLSAIYMKEKMLDRHLGEFQSMKELLEKEIESRVKSN